MASDLPYFPLFPSDWVLETKLLTLHEQGALLQLVCAMHESQVRGYLLFNGGPMPPDKVARILGIDRQPALDTLDRLLDAAVLQKDAATGVVFYPPMVKREALRKSRSESGRKGGETTQSKLSESLAPSLLEQNAKQVPKQNIKQTVEYGNGSVSSPPGVTDSKGEGGDCICEPSKFSKARIVLGFLNQQAGRKYRETAENLAVIQARIDEVKGDLEGVKQMIERQCALWKGKDQEEYLRPATLFGKQKFGAYYDNRDQPIIRNGYTRPIQMSDDDLPNYTGVGAK